MKSMEFLGNCLLTWRNNKRETADLGWERACEKRHFCSWQNMKYHQNGPFWSGYFLTHVFWQLPACFGSGHGWCGRAGSCPSERGWCCVPAAPTPRCRSPSRVSPAQPPSPSTRWAWPWTWQHSRATKDQLILPCLFLLIPCSSSRQISISSLCFKHPQWRSCDPAILGNPCRGCPSPFSSPTTRLAALGWCRVKIGTSSDGSLHFCILN